MLLHMKGSIMTIINRTFGLALLLSLKAQKPFSTVTHRLLGAGEEYQAFSYQGIAFADKLVRTGSLDLRHLERVGEAANRTLIAKARGLAGIALAGVDAVEAATVVARSWAEEGLGFADELEEAMGL